MTVETLQQLTYRLAGLAASNVFEPQPTFEESQEMPHFLRLCELVLLTQEHERERCKRLATAWIDDMNTELDVSEYIDEAQP